MQLDGTLDKFPLRELIEMIVYSSVTGVLELRAGADVGQIFFRDGQPYHASAGEQSGVDALAAMFEQQDAPFRFVADRESAESTLWMDPWELIDRGENLARRWAVVRAHIPGVDYVPALCDVASTSQIHISETVWPVLSAVDGQRSVREVADHLNLVLLDASVALATLVHQGLIVIRPPRPAPQIAAPDAVPATASAAEHSATAGFLERLLAEAQANEQQQPDLTDDDAQDRRQVYRYVDDRR